METLEAIKAWADIGSSIGVMGVLTILLVLFYKGEILSKKAVENIITTVVLQIKEVFRDELKEALDDKPKRDRKIF